MLNARKAAPQLSRIATRQVSRLVTLNTRVISPPNPSTDKSPDQIPNLNGGRIYWDNFRRLRVFFKFLALQTLPIAGLAYLYKRAHKEKLALTCVPLDTLDGILNHIFNVFRHGDCFCIVKGTAFFTRPIVGYPNQILHAKSIQEAINSLETPKADRLRQIFIATDCHTLELDHETILIVYNKTRESYLNIRAQASPVQDEKLKKELFGTLEIHSSTSGDQPERNVYLLVPLEIKIAFCNTNASATLINNGEWQLGPRIPNHHCKAPVQ
ncbi:hypothetical protein BdWA1_000801 [Babesia duncani]|uniref:Uncharacterized protein n=1 Tax=Babesia duncani TaxID=323732 RepID=A0AAD9UQ50_9APIC|nr:hypothetical protein BdWA1_000801 [Babesia duncani]